MHAFNVSEGAWWQLNWQYWLCFFYVNTNSHDELMSLCGDTTTTSPLSSLPPLLVYSLPLPLSSPYCYLVKIYTDANSTVGCVDVQLLVPGPQRLPYCHHHTTLSIKVPLPLTPSPPPSALLPIWGDPGAVLRVPHTPEAVSGPLPSHERNTQ